MQECRRTDQMCLFIRYSVLGRHTIIYVTELVILFLITLANKGQETKSAQRQDRRGEVKLCRGNEVQSNFTYTCIHVQTLSFTY